ncbi:MAG: hypothetical protein KDD82_23210 [Planctomycetes bacterium]|nr:hypothetical protein [Planctomycetota bacterium]
MGTLKRAPRVAGLLSGVALTCAALAGCSSEPPPPPPDVQAEVDDILVGFANDSESERWRGKLIEVAHRGPQELRTTLASMEREYLRSWRRGGGGATGLNNAGRRRVMEVAAELGDSPGTRDLLAKGLKDDEPNVLAAAAHGLAAWGDASGLPALLESGRKTEGEGREHAAAALKLLARPAERERFLAAHTGDDALLFEPTLASFPPAPVQRRKALTEVAEGHKNPHARKFAIQALSKLGGEGVEDLAKDALHDRTTRPAALKALEGAGDADALAAELEREPDDADRVVAHLYRVQSAAAAQAAGRVLASDVNEDVRVVLLQGFYAPAGEKRPSAYAKGAGHEAVVEALRAAIERERGQALRVAVVALGQLGDPAVDDGALLRLQGRDDALDAALLVGLGHLGGEVAAGHLMHTLESNPELAQAAGEGLQALAKGEHQSELPGRDLIVLLDHDEQVVREQALAILQALAGDRDDRGYKPSADRESRQPGKQAWEAWWDSR